MQALSPDGKVRLNWAFWEAQGNLKFNALPLYLFINKMVNDIISTFTLQFHSEQYSEVHGTNHIIRS